MRIAEAARRSGLSVDTVRFYEKSCLLPEILRGADGQRRFTPENIDWLILLRSLRETGMPLRDMRRFAALYRSGDRTMPDRKAVLLAHAESLKERRAELDRCEAILARKLALYDQLEEKTP